MSVFRYQIIICNITWEAWCGYVIGSMSKILQLWNGEGGDRKIPWCSNGTGDHKIQIPCFLL